VLMQFVTSRGKFKNSSPPSKTTSRGATREAETVGGIS
jgi:hypothetical protein